MKKIIHKPTVPEFVSVWIEKQDGLDAIHIAVVKALESKNEQLVGWVFENQDEFALAYASRHKVAKILERKELLKNAKN